MNKKWNLYIFIATLLLTSETLAKQQSSANNTRCFRFIEHSPERDFKDKDNQFIVGCYARVDEHAQLAFVREKDGADLLTTALTHTQNDKTKLRHFSMSAGEVSVIEQQNYEINPLPIPATLNEAIDSPNNRGEITELSTVNQSLREQLKGILEIYKNPEHERINVPSFEATGSKRIYDEEVYLPEEKQPTDGYWWPHIGLPLAKDEYSPLAKYDAYVRSRTGSNPNSVGWERSRHASNVSWAGHCNGWVSSSILYGYDEVNLRDDANNTTITSSDMQGLRSVLSYCTRNAFYGRRYNGDRSDINDIYPERFHRTLTYYIKHLQKPVAYDYRNEPAVDNHIISGYKFTFHETDEERKWLVQADLRSHKYSYDDYVHVKRIAPTYTRTYWYYLWENSRGRFYKGEWVNQVDHPDFMWVPLSESRCGNENPRVRASWIEHMLRNLPNTSLTKP